MMMTGLGISIHCLQPQELDNPLICSLHRFLKNIYSKNLTDYPLKIVLTTRSSRTITSTNQQLSIHILLRAVIQI